MPAAVDPGTIIAPFLAQGTMGAAMVVLALVIWRLWTTLQACQAVVTTLQDKNAELQRALLERALTAMNTMGGVVADNTKAIESMLLRSKPHD